MLYRGKKGPNSPINDHWTYGAKKKKSREVSLRRKKEGRKGTEILSLYPGEKRKRE